MLKNLHLISIAFLLFCCAETVQPLSMLGRWHKVQRGDTVESVARKYGVSAAELAELNQIAETGRISDADQIFIPLGSGKPPGDGIPSSGNPEHVTPGMATEERAASKQISDLSPTSTPDSSDSGQCGKDGRSCYLWPVDGEVIRWFGDGAKRSDSASDGLDISAPEGTEVKAAANGKVIYSGDAIKGYGNLILLRHEGNIITVYAHNRRNFVKEGTGVIRGEKIAEVGSSGAATDPLLHFEVRVNEQPVNPMLYLPTKE